MSEAHWLDKHIAEQAAFYGRTVDEHAFAMGEVIECQEAIDTGLIPEPVRVEEPK